VSVAPPKAVPVFPRILGRIGGVELTIEGDSALCTPNGKQHWILRLTSNGATQTLEMSSVGEPYPCSGTITDVVVDDYNFDGLQDLAVPRDRSGPYGSATYEVLLAKAESGAFERAPELSKLTESHMGLFRVDRSRRVILASSKSGCCTHWESEYAVDDSVPRHLRTVTEALKEHLDPGAPSHAPDRCTMIVTEELTGRPATQHERPCAEDERP